MADIDLDLVKKPFQSSEQDPRNQGLNRIYFYLRKHDMFLFALDKELQASHLHRQKEFPQMYYYLGWTDGVDYQKGMEAIEKEVRLQVRQEANEAKLMGDAAKEYSYKRTAELMREREDAIFELLKTEAKKAQQNPESKQGPRDFRRIDLEGNPQSGGMIWDTIKIMR